jgi:hypothetical protein
MRFMDATRLGGFSRRIRTSDELVAALFSSGENGALFDAADLSSMRQSRDGSTAAAVGSPVGYWLDKRLMGGQSAAAVIAGQPNVHPITGSGYTTGGSGSISGNIWTKTGGSFAQVRPTVATVTPGKTYSISVTATAISVGGFSLAFLSDATLVGETFGSISAAGVHTYIVTAPAGADRLSIRGGNLPAGSFDLSQFIVREVPGNHAIAPSDAARPVLRQPTAFRFLEHDLVDDVLNVTLPDLGSNVTIARATAGTTTILTGQTIGAGVYSIPAVSELYAHLMIDRALTASETELVNQWLNTRRGV